MKRKVSYHGYMAMPSIIFMTGILFFRDWIKGQGIWAFIAVCSFYFLLFCFLKCLSRKTPAHRILAFLDLGGSVTLAIFLPLSILSISLHLTPLQHLLFLAGGSLLAAYAAWLVQQKMP